MLGLESGSAKGETFAGSGLGGRGGKSFAFCKTGRGGGTC